MNIPDILKLKDRYQNGKDNIGKDLIKPCLELCTHYRRGTGFFSSSALKSYASSLEHIIEDNVKIDILCSPIIQDKSLINVLERNSTPELKVKTIRQLAENVLLMAVGFHLDSKRIDYRSKLLSYLIANGQLECKFAIPKNFEWPAEGDNTHNIYHVKLGYFEFPDGSRVAFDGSFNESDSGHSYHVDRTQVYCSWIPSDEIRLKGIIDDVDIDWNETNEYISVYPLSKDTLEIIKKLSPKKRPRKPNVPQVKSYEKEKIIPLTQTLWPHQKKAVLKFLNNKSGILEMATGSGKTTTAIEIIKQLFLSNKINSVIICTYGSDLLDQWYKEIEGWIIRSESQKLEHITTFRAYKTHDQLQAYLNNPINSILIISRDAPRLKRLLTSKQIDKSKILLIHDEIHGFGSPAMVSNLSSLHKNIAYRLGLSATPEREYDEAGTDFIKKEIGEVIFTFTLHDAIEQGTLCEFDYITRDFILTDADKERRKSIFSRQARAAKEGNPWSEETLYRELSKVVKKAELKPLVLNDYLHENEGALSSSIIFVLDREQGDEICKVVSHFTHKYKTYYAGTEKVYLDMLASNEIDTLIACERLNEGIDIKGLKSVFLIASPKSKLDTIQRIGRCLRKDPNNPMKRALVVDFILEEDSDNERVNTDNQRKEWLMEISRSRFKNNKETE